MGKGYLRTAPIRGGEKDDQVAVLQRVFRSGQFRAVVGGEADVRDRSGRRAISHTIDVSLGRGEIAATGKARGQERDGG